MIAYLKLFCLPFLTVKKHYITRIKNNGWYLFDSCWILLSVNLQKITLQHYNNTTLQLLGQRTIDYGQRTGSSRLMVHCSLFKKTKILQHYNITFWVRRECIDGIECKEYNCGVGCTFCSLLITYSSIWKKLLRYRVAFLVYLVK